MKEFGLWLDGVPFWAVVAIVVLISSGIAATLTRSRMTLLKWALALGSPFVIAWCIYWIPYWTGAVYDQRGVWMWVLVAPCGMAGAVAALVTIIGLRIAHPSAAPGPS